MKTQTPKKTTVVHCKRDKYDVYIGRPGSWGNPFVIGRDGNRATVISKYRDWIKTQPQLLARLPELRGKVLGCWCHPESCHGDVLAEMADATFELKESNDEQPTSTEPNGDQDPS